LIFASSENVYETVWRELLYNIVTEFGIPIKLGRLIKMCLNETHNKVLIYKNLSHAFPTQNGLKQGNALSPLVLDLL